MNNVYCGLTTLVPDVNVVISDSDGADIIDEFMKEVVYFRERPSDNYKPIHFYINTGSFGDMSTERVVLYIYRGIPFIMSTAERLYGSDEYDAKFDTNGGMFISRFASKDCKNAYSLGFVAKNVSVEKFAYRYVNENPIMPDVNIDAKNVGMSVLNGVLKNNGTVFSPGKYLYDVYTADATISRMIRSYKDFSRDPTNETNIPENMKEILLYGGYPEIVNIGMLSTDYGYVYDIWIPNDKDYYYKAKDIVENREMPMDIFEVEQDDMIESYAIHCKELHDIEKKIDEDIENSYDSDEPEDEEPTVIELP